MTAPSTTHSSGTWASTSSSISEHDGAPRVASPASSRHRSRPSPSAEIRASATARRRVVVPSRRVSSPLNTGSSSRYSSHSGTVSRANASTRDNTSPLGSTGSSSQYPSTSPSTNDRSGMTRSTWPASQTASVSSEPPPEYRSLASSVTDGYDATSEENDGPDPRIVLALDYGTTYSGIAWMQDDGVTRRSLEDLLVLDEFPPNIRGAPKVPSTYSYDLARHDQVRKEQWGFDIDEKSTVLRWTKSRLKLQKLKDELNALKDLVEGLLSVEDKELGKERAYDRQTPDHLSKSPADVVKSYLWRLAMCWRDVMNSRGQHTLNEVPLEIVITHPAIWPYEARNATYQAVVAAFPKTHFKTLRGISFSPEPESCALYTIQELIRGGVSFTVGECFIICDAGGGTIDLGSYRIDRMSPLNLTKVGILTGDDFGATLIDQAFLEWLNNKIPELDLSPKTYLKNGMYQMDGIINTIITNFQETKHQFGDDAGAGQYRVNLPRFKEFGVDIERDDLDNIMVTSRDLQGMFDRSVNRILELLEKQYKNTTNFEKTPGVANKVTNIFMAGGFSESKYLLRQVTRCFDRYPDVKVRKANDCWTSVAKGAVLRGMGLGMLPGAPAQTSQVHVGICLTQPYQAHIHGNADAMSVVKDKFYGENVVMDQISWLIRKGSVIPPGGAIEASKVIRIDHNMYEYEENKTVTLKWVILRRDPPLLALSAATDEEVKDIKIALRALQEVSVMMPRSLIHGTEHRSVNARVSVSVSEHGATISVEDNKGIKKQDSVHFD